MLLIQLPSAMGSNAKPCLFFVVLLFSLHSSVVVSFASGRRFSTRGDPTTRANLGGNTLNDGHNSRFCGLNTLSSKLHSPIILRGSDDDENYNVNSTWFFKRPTFDRSSREEAASPEKIPRDLPKIRTLVRSKKENDTQLELHLKNTKVSSRPKKILTKKALSPLELLDEGDQTPLLDLSKPQTIFGIAALAGLSAVTAISYSLGLTPEDFMHGAQTLVTDPQAFLQQLIDGVKSLGPVGVVYYALIYMIAEILAIPATPLTLSAGYLFGVQQGILSVLAGATGAACIGFWISRIFLRDYVESTLLAPASDGNESRSNTLTKLDKAIGEEGFKLLVLIRLSPIFPFSVTNYLYGASSIDFGSYLLGTFIGFVPTTTAYVYTGMVGQALTVGQGGDQPWYVYAGGFAVLAVLVKLVTDIATGIIEAIDDDA